MIVMVNITMSLLLTQTHSQGLSALNILQLGLHSIHCLEDVDNDHFCRKRVVLTRPDTNYVQYLAINISSAVQGSRLYNWRLTPENCTVSQSVRQSVLTVSESSWKYEI